MKKLIYICLITFVLVGCVNENQDTKEEIVEEDTSGMFTTRDLSLEYEITDTIHIETLKEDTLTIEEEGTYEIVGENEDLMILIDASEDAKIELVLNDVTIKNTDGPCIYVRSANKVFITTMKDSENTLVNGGSYTLIDENNLDGVIFSKSDLTLKGEGILNITATSGNAIVSKDDLVLASGQYKLNAAAHTLDANNSIRVAEGTYELEAGEDAFHSEHDEDENLGFVYIKDGDITIQAQDDGIHASSNVTIENGNINIENSYEGIEGLTIDINGGNINVNASDDGLNAAGGNDNSQKEGTFGKNDVFVTTEGAYVKITDGKLVVNAQGDGLDSNGDLYISGGTIIVYGPTNGANGTLDYGTEGTITGGTIIGLGSREMVQTLSSETQGVILVNGSGNNGSSIVLSDSEGNVILECEGIKQFSTILLSSSDILSNNTYILSIDGATKEIEMTSLDYNEVGSSFGPGGNGMEREPRR